MPHVDGIHGRRGRRGCFLGSGRRRGRCRAGLSQRAARLRGGQGLRYGWASSAVLSDGGCRQRCRRFRAAPVNTDSAAVHMPGPSHHREAEGDQQGPQVPRP